MAKLYVELGDRSYPIFIGAGYLNDRNKILDYVHGTQIAIVTNTTISPIYIKEFIETLGAPVDIIELPDGEQFKNLDTLNLIFDTLLQQRHTRKTTLIAFGGGVIGDMTGFAAACYQRGVDFIQIPTTLLSQVDSSVGGKTGVNHALGKNMIGAFHQPNCVVIDTDVLRTLPDRELSAGIAEVIKYGLIADKNFFEWLEGNIQALLDRDSAALNYAIEKSCAIKAQVVAEDEKESGIRAILNLGHTFGHAIEADQGYGKWLHGEAVGAGMVMACDLSVRLGWIDDSILDRAKTLIKKAGLPVSAPNSMNHELFLKYMRVDKKNTAGKIRLVLLQECGKAVITEDYDASLLEATIEQSVSGEQFIAE